MQYYGTRLSENISRRDPEGYLLCLNVPVARTGVQEYLPAELGLSGVSGLPALSSLIPVLRPPEEVFSPAAVASFEGMPVTDGHPPDGVDAGNIRVLQKGHAHNVRRGTGDESDLLLADLIITDPALIRAVLSEGRREISCGYTYELCEEEGRYIQRQIRGNHVAVVDAGRAGPRVCIHDRKPVIERRKTDMKKSLSKVLARMAKDGDIGTVAEIIEEMLDPAEEGTETGLQEEEPANEPVEGPETEIQETKHIMIDEGALDGILERLDRIVALLEPAAADGDVAEEVSEAVEEALEAAALNSEDPAAGRISDVIEEILDPVAPVIAPDPGEDEACGIPETLRTGDALRAALSAVRPVLARMPRRVRSKVASDIAARLRCADSRGTAGPDVYAALASARQRTAPASADLGKRIMEKRNVNYRGEGAGRRG